MNKLFRILIIVSFVSCIDKIYSAALTQKDLDRLEDQRWAKLTHAQRIYEMKIKADEEGIKAKIKKESEYRDWLDYQEQIRLKELAAKKSMAPAEISIETLPIKFGIPERIRSEIYVPSLDQNQDSTSSIPAAYISKPKKIKKALEENFINQEFLKAISAGNCAIAEQFIRAGADILVRNTQGITSLMLAVLSNNLQTVNLIVEHITKMKPSQWDITSEFLENIRKFLNYVDQNGHSVLHIAAIKNKEVLDVLLKSKLEINVDLKNLDGKTYKDLQEKNDTIVNEIESYKNKFKGDKLKHELNSLLKEYKVNLVEHSASINEIQQKLYHMLYVGSSENVIVPKSVDVEVMERYKKILTTQKEFLYADLGRLSQEDIVRYQITLEKLDTINRELNTIQKQIDAASNNSVDVSEDDELILQAQKVSLTEELVRAKIAIQLINKTLSELDQEYYKTLNLPSNVTNLVVSYL